MTKFLDDTGLTHFWEKIKANFFRYNRDQTLDMNDIRTPGIYTGDFVASSCPYKMSSSTEKYHLIVTEYSDSTVENMVSQIAIYKLKGVSLIYHRHSYLDIQEGIHEFAWGDWHKILTQRDLDDLAGEDIPYTAGSTLTIKDKIDAIQTDLTTAQTDIEVNTQAIAGALKIANVQSLKRTTSITSSTSLTYTGVKVVIPANSIYTLMASAVYIYNTPSRCLITTSETSSATLPNADASTGLHKTTVVSGYASREVSLYIWAQYSGQGANRIDTDGFYISLS